MANCIDFRLYLITDRTRVAPGHSLPAAVAAALRGGVKAVQLREKDLPAAELLPLARSLRDLTRQHNARLLINDRIDIALAVQADGVHLGEHSVPAGVARRLVGPDLLIGVSCHGCDDISRAAAQGADFVTFGPVYETPSKAAFGPPQGLQALAEACRASSLPVFALGGMTAERTAEVLRAGARGVALISAILASPDPGSAAAAFHTLLT
jgi:thiamine-phosphate pyrophosphorylase